MDLRLFARVLWRFRIVTGIGLALAVVLAGLTLFRVGPHGLTYRRQETYLSYARLLVTQQGFPWGRLGVAPAAAPGVALDRRADPVPFADPGRLASLAQIYSNLADSDAVHALMQRFGAPPGTTEAAPLLDTRADALPVISIAAHASTPRRAMALAAAESKALTRFIVAEQAANGIAPTDRVKLAQIMAPGHAALEKGRSLALPVVVFVAVLLGAFGLAFLLENLWPLEVAGGMPVADPPAA